MKKNLIISILLCLISCKETHYIDISNYSTIINQKEESICILSENINIVGNINSLNFFNEDIFIVTTGVPEPNIIIYNTDGKQILEIHNVGRGPGEYLDPSIIKCCNERIYIWCQQQLKFLVYDLNGNLISEITNFFKSINNFTIYKNLLCLYTSGGFNDTFIEIYDMDSSEFIKKIGYPQEEHLILSILSSSGGLLQDSIFLYYTTLNELSINSINLLSWEEKDYRFIDSEFKVQKLQNKARNIINNDRFEAINYINNNSVVNNLFKVNDFFILKTEIGSYKLENNMLDNKLRFDKYYIFDNEFNHISSIKEKHSFEKQNKLFSNFKNKLYAIVQVEKDDTFLYELIQISFQ